MKNLNNFNVNNILNNDLLEKVWSSDNWKEKYLNLVENNYFYMKKYMKDFYRSFENISQDTFMEIEGAINEFEYIKHFTLNDLLLINNILEVNYHKNYKNVLYIYSCFDKIASLFYMFCAKNGNNYFKKNISFFKDMSKENINNYFENKIVIEKSEFFIKSKLFQDFKKLRNEITHEHTMPMDNYFTNLYSFVGLFLLAYYIKEILIKYFEK